MFRKLMCLSFVVLLSGLAVPSVDKPADSALAAYWKFDETSGTTALDSSGNGNNGTLVGDPKWVAGKFGGALEFNGNDYVNCGNGPAIQLRNQMTIAFWFKVQAFSSNWEAFLAKGDGAYRASSAGSGKATHMGITAGNFFDGTIIVTDNQWHHWCGTYDGTTAKIFVDGKLDAQRTYGGQIGDSRSYNLYIGENSQAPGRFLHGLMDEVRLYNRALTDVEIMDVMAGPGSGTGGRTGAGAGTERPMKR